MTILRPCSRRIGSSARAATSFEPPAFQGTIKVMSRCGKFDWAWPTLPCIVAAKASTTAAALIILVSSDVDVCYNKHQQRVKAPYWIARQNDGVETDRA